MARRAKPRLTLKPDVLKDLLSKEAVDTILLQGVEGGFHVLIGFGVEEQPLGLAREDRPRLFKTIDSAKNHLDKFGVTQVSVDWTRHSPPPKPVRKPKGPGRAAARERTAQAAAHNAWFRASVGEALAQVDDGTAELFDYDPSPEDLKRELDEIVARGRARREAHARRKERT